MSTLEDAIEFTFKQQEYIVLKRKNYCDILAVNPNMSLAYLVECKDFYLSTKEQKMAVRQLNKNYVHALELLITHRLWPEHILRVLVARRFAHQSRNILQYTPEELIAHILGLPIIRKPQ